MTHELVGEFSGKPLKVYINTIILVYSRKNREDHNFSVSRQKNIASLVKLYYLMLTWDTTAQGTAIGGGGGACCRSRSSVLHDEAPNIRAGKGCITSTDPLISARPRGPVTRHNDCR
jgi:hypothetical protein